MYTIRELHNFFSTGVISPTKFNEGVLVLAQSKLTDGVFIKLTPERFLVATKAAQERFKKAAPIGMLDGITIAWKDLFDQAGEITTAGSLTQLNIPPAVVDAPVVKLLEAAGACSLGRTNLSEFAFSGIGINPHFGTPSSVLFDDEDCLPGGSSSGSAVAVGLGLAQIGMGTDTSGSIRVPAALNGLVGFRSSCHRYSTEGVFPLSPNLDTVGVLAKNVDDIKIVDTVLARNTKSNIPVASNTIYDLSENLDIAWENDIIKAFEQSLKAFEKDGYRIKKLKLPAVKTIYECIASYGTLVGLDAIKTHRELLTKKNKSPIDPMILSRLEAVKPISEKDYTTYLQLRDKLIVESAEDIGNALVVCPTVARIRFNKNHYCSNKEDAMKINALLLSITMIGSFLDFPGVALPLRSSQGDWGSILVSVAQGNDLLLLSQAEHLEKILKQEQLWGEKEFIKNNNLAL